MDNKILKSSKAICILALIPWGLWTLIIILRFLRFAGLINFNVYLGIDIAPIAWYDDEAIIAQYIELAGYAVTNVVMISMVFMFIYKSIKGMNVNEVFSRGNVRLLYGMAAVSFFYELFTTNRGILYGSREVMLDTDPFITPLIFLVVAVFYRLALHAYEENRLTI